VTGIRLGISGLGSAAGFMIRAATEDPRIILAAAADPLQHPREAFVRDFGAVGHESFVDLCKDPTLEAIYIASPHEFHAEQAILALEHGKHVIVEKPLALALADCDDVIRAAAKSGKIVIVGHTHAFDPSIMKIRELALGGEFGRLGMILTFNYTDFLYRPRRPEELVTARGGGIAFNQISHQIDMVRAVAGVNVRSVRANVGRLDPSRPTEGNSTVFLDLDDGAAASLIYSGYDFFDSDELHGWIAESGVEKPTEGHSASKRLLQTDTRPERERRHLLAYGSRTFSSTKMHLPHFGTFIASFERADVRVTADGIAVFDAEGKRDIPLLTTSTMPGHRNVLNALWAAAREGQPCIHDASWGKTTLEIILGVLASAQERCEIGVNPMQSALRHDSSASKTNSVPQASHRRPLAQSAFP